jgi:hypothetical protein
MATEVVDAPVPLAEAAPEAAAAAAEAPATPAGDAKPVKAKKAAAPRKRTTSTHPPYAEVIELSRPQGPLLRRTRFPVVSLVVFAAGFRGRLDLTDSPRVVVGCDR